MESVPRASRARDGRDEAHRHERDGRVLERRPLASRRSPRDARSDHATGPQSEVDRVKKDRQFMALLRSHVERDKEILDRLAE